MSQLTNMETPLAIAFSNGDKRLKTAKGSHEYWLNNAKTLAACRMADNRWMICRYINGEMHDTGIDHSTLRECREWAKNSPLAQIAIDHAAGRK